MKKAIVIKDMISIHKPYLTSTEGQQVNVLVAVPKGTILYLSSALGMAEGQAANRDVYLTSGGTTRSSYAHGPIDIEIAVVVDGITYRGNDLYTPHELEILE